MAIDHVRKWESLGPSEIREHQLARLREVLAAAVENDFYRSRWQPGVACGLGGSLSIEAFREGIPTIGKADFLADQADDPPFGRCVDPTALRDGTQLFFYTTSGTSGQGQEVHIETAAEADVAAEVYAFMFDWAGVGPGDLTFMTLPLSMLGGGRLEYRAALACGLSVLPVGTYDVHRKLALLKKFRPKVVIGTTTYFGHLSAVSEGGPPGDGSVDVLFCGGEGVSPEYYRRLESEWGARCFDRYGSTQSCNDHMFSCSTVAPSDDGDKVLHNVDPYMLIEVIDPDTGEHVGPWERGEIVVTSLYRKVAPLIRYRMNDTAIYVPPGACRCGRPFGGVLSGSISRLDNMVRIKGVNVWPQAVESVLLSEDTVDEYVVALETDRTGSDRISVCVMPKEWLAPPLKTTLARRLEAALHERIGIRFQCEVLAPGTLARSEYKAKNWIDRRQHVRRIV